MSYNERLVKRIVCVAIFCVPILFDVCLTAKLISKFCLYRRVVERSGLLSKVQPTFLIIRWPQRYILLQGNGASGNHNATLTYIYKNNVFVTVILFVTVIPIFERLLFLVGYTVVQKVEYNIETLRYYLNQFLRFIVH